ncbi:MAG: alpha/beta fold hydrolase [Planctomycetota bacterium]
MSSSEALFPHPTQYHAIDAQRMAYVDVGPAEPATATGRTLLCVHGNPTWGFYYRRVIDSFSKDHRIVAVDHLGCGRSDKPPRDDADYTLAGHRDRLVDLIETRDLKNVTLLAHDWGGAIGLAAALRTFQRFDSVVLLNTGAFPPPYLPFRISVCRWPVIGRIGVQGFNGFARAAITMAMSRNKLDPAVAAGLLEPYDNWSHRVAIDAFVQDIPMSPRHPTHDVLKMLEEDLSKWSDHPIDLIWGMRDWCFRPECLRRFEAIWPHARGTEIADAGHYVLEDAPEETLSAIARHLSDLPAIHSDD